MVRTRVAARLALTLMLMLSLSVSLAWATGKQPAKQSMQKANAVQAQTPRRPDKREETLTRAQVPAPVISAFEKDYPGTTPTAYTRKSEGGAVQYDIAHQNKDGHAMRHVIYTPTGTVEETTELITTADLPAAVQTTIRNQYPDQKIVNSVKVTRGTASEYEVAVSSTKQLTDVILDANGTVIKTVNESPVGMVKRPSHTATRK